MIDWSNERYVRVYTRDTAEWLSLSFEAQSLFLLVLRKVDRSGVLPLGKLGRRAVAVAVGHGARWSDLDGPLAELETDGCVVVAGDNLTVPNFLEAQEARASGAQRQRELRERRRGLSLRDGDETLRDVTQRHENVTRGNAASHGVTPSLAVPYLAVPSRAESESTREGGTSTSSPPLPPSHGIPDWQSILSRESKGRIDPTAGSAALMVGMREAIAVSGYTRGDLEALGRLAATGALERLVRGKGARRTVTLPDLHGFNADWAPLTDAIVEARERARNAEQVAVRAKPAQTKTQLASPETLAAGARTMLDTIATYKREQRIAEEAALRTAEASKP